MQDGSALASALDDETLAGDSIHGLVHAAHAATLLAASLQRAQQGSSSTATAKGKGPRAKASAPNSSLHQVCVCAQATLPGWTHQKAVTYHFASQTHWCFQHPHTSRGRCTSSCLFARAAQDASLTLIGTLPTLIRKHQTQPAVVSQEGRGPRSTAR